MIDAITDLVRPDDPDEVVARLSALTRPLGYNTLALGQLAGVANRTLPAFFHHTWPPSWIGLYAAAGLVGEDPLVARALADPSPFSWGDIASRIAAWTTADGKTRYLDVVREFGWQDGWCVPVHLPDSRKGLVSYQSPQPHNNATARTQATMAGLYAFLRIAELHERRAGEGLLPGVGARARQVLERLVAGDEDAEIARRLGITERTVQHHVTLLRRRLGANTRAQLGACAVRLGIQAS